MVPFFVGCLHFCHFVEGLIWHSDFPSPFFLRVCLVGTPTGRVMVDFIWGDILDGEKKVPDTLVEFCLFGWKP